MCKKIVYTYVSRKQKSEVSRIDSLGNTRLLLRLETSIFFLSLLLCRRHELLSFLMFHTTLKDWLSWSLLSSNPSGGVAVTINGTQRFRLNNTPPLTTILISVLRIGLFKYRFLFLPRSTLKSSNLDNHCTEHLCERYFRVSYSSLLTTHLYQHLLSSSSSCPLTVLWSFFRFSVCESSLNIV